MSDLISRQAVLNTLDNMDKILDEDRTIENYKELLKECYEILPPVKPKQRWIPVSERLPEEQGVYLVTIENGNHNYNYIDTVLCNPLYKKGFRSPDVIAWMPLPEPYKAESEE